MDAQVVDTILESGAVAIALGALYVLYKVVDILRVRVVNHRNNKNHRPGNPGPQPCVEGGILAVRSQEHHDVVKGLLTQLVERQNDIIELLVVIKDRTPR